MMADLAHFGMLVLATALCFAACTLQGAPRGMRLANAALGTVCLAFALYVIKTSF